MRNASSQAMRAGKKKSRSFFLVSSLSVRAPCATYDYSTEASLDKKFFFQLMGESLKALCCLFLLISSIRLIS